VAGRGQRRPRPPQGDHAAWKEAAEKAKKACNGDRAAIRAKLLAIGPEPKILRKASADTVGEVGGYAASEAKREVRVGALTCSNASSPGSRGGHASGEVASQRRNSSLTV
jgi:hypothetical protein